MNARKKCAASRQIARKTSEELQVQARVSPVVNKTDQRLAGMINLVWRAMEYGSEWGAVLDQRKLDSAQGGGPRRSFTYNASLKNVWVSKQV